MLKISGGISLIPPLLQPCLMLQIVSLLATPLVSVVTFSALATAGL